MDYPRSVEVIPVACDPNLPIQLGITVEQAEAHTGGLIITKIQRDSCIDRNGRFRIGDVIIRVNEAGLKEFSFSEAQVVLKNELKISHSNNTPLSLTVLHSQPNIQNKVHSSQSHNKENVRNENHINNNNNHTHSLKRSSPTSTTQNAPVNSGHFVGALNTRKIGVVHRIQLVKGINGGLGFKIAKRDNQTGAQCPIFITTINPTGAAVRDGRLKPGDMLLEVNGQTMAGKSQEEAASIFRSIGINQTADIVISRQEDVSKGDKIVSETQYEAMKDYFMAAPTDAEDAETLVFDVPLNDTKSAGLGISLKSPRVAMDGKPIDLGIWVDKIITGGAAWKDGRLHPDDKIIAINGISLVGLSNAMAKETLTTAACRGEGPDAVPSIIRLKVLRRKNPSPLVTETNNLLDLEDETPNLHGSIEANTSSYMNFDVAQNNPSMVHDETQSSGNAAASSESHSSFLTVIDQTVGPNADSSSSDKSRENPSYNISSPLTQASNSLRLGPGTDKSDDSGKTVASVTSPITDVTNLIDNSDEIGGCSTQPKVIDESPITTDTLDLNGGMQQASSRRSLDDDLTESETAEHFQRDGFGRQSISEKRHAQLSAINTDTYRRSRKAKEERERQMRNQSEIERKKLIEQANSRRSLNLGHLQHNKNIDSGVSSSEDMRAQNLARVKAMGQTTPKKQLTSLNDQVIHFSRNGVERVGGHRELPVDVQNPSEPAIQVTPLEGDPKFVDVPNTALVDGSYPNYRTHNPRHDHIGQGYHTMDARSSRIRATVNGDPSSSRNVFAPTCCWKCRSPGTCPYHGTRSGDSSDQSIEQRMPSKVDIANQRRLKKSNSLESIQQGHSGYINPIDPFTGNGIKTIRPFVTHRVADSSMGPYSDAHMTMGREPNLRSTNSFAPSIASTQYTNMTNGMDQDNRALLNARKEVDVGSNSSGSKKGISLFRFFKLGSRKSKKKITAQESDSKCPEKADNESHELSHESHEDNRTVTNHSRGSSYVNGIHPQIDAHDDRFIARQAAQREQDRINEHYMKMLHQQQQITHMSSQPSRAQLHFDQIGEHTSALRPRAPLMGHQMMRGQIPPTQQYTNNSHGYPYQYSYPYDNHGVIQQQHTPQTIAKPHIIRHPQMNSQLAPHMNQRPPELVRMPHQMMHQAPHIVNPMQRPWMPVRPVMNVMPQQHPPIDGRMVQVGILSNHQQQMKQQHSMGQLNQRPAYFTFV